MDTVPQSVIRLAVSIAAVATLAGCGGSTGAPVKTQEPREVVVQLSAGAPAADSVGVHGCLNQHPDLAGRWIGDRYATVQVGPQDNRAADTLIACLSTIPSVVPPLTLEPLHPAKATSATFSGTWFGHTRGLQIKPSGDGSESINDGCCYHIIDVSFRLTQFDGTPSKAVARGTVTKVVVADTAAFDRRHPAPVVGETIALRLTNGVITDPLTDAQYCDSSADAKGTCGA